MDFGPEALWSCLRRFDAPAAYRVAFSGGPDSTALLCALVALGDRVPSPVNAIHVDHRIHPGSTRWATHCQAVCTRLGVPLTSLVVSVDAQDPSGPEAAARRARYAALAACLAPGELVLTAHHRDDQVETVLLALLRGSGPEGLAGMPRWRPLGAGGLARPLLDVDRAALHAYAERCGVATVADPSNDSARLARGHLRQRVVPALAAYWSGHGEAVARSARLCAEAATILSEVGRADRARCAGPRTDTLSVAGLTALSLPRQRNALRIWLRERGLPTPSEAVLAELVRQVHASDDRQPRVTWPGGEVRRFAGSLYAMGPVRPLGVRGLMPWRLTKLLRLPNGWLEAVPVRGAGLRRHALSDCLEVGYRVGGERFQPRGSGGRQALSELFRRQQVPPWERDRRPLAYRDGRLLWVAGLGVAEGAGAAPGEPGWELRWRAQG